MITEAATPNVVECALKKCRCHWQEELERIWSINDLPKTRDHAGIHIDPIGLALMLTGKQRNR